AEFVSAFVANPVSAMNNAPNLVKRLKQNGIFNTKEWKAVVRFSNVIRTNEGLPPEQRIINAIHYPEKTKQTFTQRLKSVFTRFDKEVGDGTFNWTATDALNEKLHNDFH